MEKLDIRNKADIATDLPLISIIGRPNAGKSTLFNRLIGKRRAITDPTPGVTRDPIPERWLLGNNAVTLVDSGGVKLDKEGIDYAVTDKSLSLLEQSDAIIFLMDCTEVTAEDLMLVERLRPYTDKVVLAVNKVDDPRRDDLVWNFFSYGYQRVVGISAAHGSGIEELEDSLLGMLDLEREEEEPEEPETIKLAILGKPNTGKSTLMNLLTGHDISIVSPIAGTTRDAVDINLDIKGYPVIFTDTAGIRNADDVIEQQGIEIAFDKIRQADMVLALFDASTDTPEIFENIKKESKNKMLYLANKSDKLTFEQCSTLEKQGCMLISAKYNQGIEELMDEIATEISERFTSGSGLLLTRSRYRQALTAAVENLDNFSFNKEIELSAEDLRLAARELGKITGKIEVDEILDKIFGDFCIGK